jgi:hypothetical protein
VSEPAPLTKDEIRYLLRECVTVAGPGEILVIQPGADFTPNHIREIQGAVDWWLGANAPQIKALVIPGEAHQIVRRVRAPFSPIIPVPVDEPAASRPEPRRGEYHTGGTCATPREDDTCGCGSRAGRGDE